MTVRWLEAAQRAQAAAVWERLDAGVCASWPWTSTWLETVGAGVEHRFAVVEDRGDPIGVVLVCRSRTRPLAPATVHVGTAGEAGRGVHVEDNRLPAAPGRRADVARAVADALQQRRDWQRLELHGFVEQDAEALLAHLPPARRDAQPSPVVALPADGDVLAVLRSGPRQRIRRSRKAFGPLHATWAEDEDTALDVLDELIDLHQQRWTAAGEPGAFAEPDVVAFHRTLVPRLLPRGEVMLFRLRDDDGATVGCLYGFVDAGRLLFYQGGFTPMEDNKRRPGLTTHAACLQACRDRGLHTYDLLAGDARYKRELATGERTLVWATVERPGVRTGLDRGRRTAKALARRAAGARG